MKKILTLAVIAVALSFAGVADAKSRSGGFSFSKPSTSTFKPSPAPVKTAAVDQPHHFWHIGDRRECTADEVKNNPQACERMEGKALTKGGGGPTNGWAE